MSSTLSAATAMAITTYLLTPPHPNLRRLSPPSRRPRAEVPRAHRLTAVVAAIGVLLLIGIPWGVLPAAVAFVLIPRALSRLEPAAVRQRTAHITRDLPLAVDLLSACLRAGRPPQQALTLVATAVRGPLSSLLTKVAHHLALGAEPADAWALLRSEPACAPVARAIDRSIRSGAPLSKTLELLADDTRQSYHHAADQRARAAESRSALPLGLCFLPAFILLSIVPTIADVLIPYLIKP
ncbi:type II secretion system F family protein [Kribbella kalugense]|uniref:Type II secretion system (T2SS) protein F n=1 Tax=Kribbella kalugense TaxID=2512221 RepID=A0A4V3G7D8_9ACTN|nr:type II secretion system F family protein [Kribbella kalugense]TDW18744.1 type II secretion system (T2SS) protein F [Kribbella kalugense]